MTHRPLQILHLEDDAKDAELIVETLDAGGLSCSVERVATRAGYLSALKKGGHDLILADFRLPDFDGFSALEEARTRCPEVPFLFVTGVMGDEKAVETLKMGATDYVLKTQLVKLVAAVTRALEEVEERKERKRVEKERTDLIVELREALSKIKVLSGLLPICSMCKKIRDDKGDWSQLEWYIREHSDAEFTHGICPECMVVLMKD